MSRQWAVTAVLLILLIAGAATEFGRSRSTLPTAVVPTPTAVAPSATGPLLPVTGVTTPLKPSATLPLPATLAAGDSVVADPDQPDSAVYAVSTASGAATLKRLLPGPGKPIRLATAATPAAVDIARWNNRAAAFVISRSGGQLQIAVHALPSGKQLDTFSVPEPPQPQGGKRELFIAPGGGLRPDLFVIDRGRRDDRMEVRLLSGGSGFVSTDVDILVPQGAGFPPSQWTLDVADLLGLGKADLVLTSRTAQTGSDSREVHALAGETNYARFLFQVPTTLRSAAPADERSTLAFRDNRPSWLVIDGRSARAFPLLDLRALRSGRP